MARLIRPEDDIFRRVFQAPDKALAIEVGLARVVDDLLGRARHTVGPAQSNGFVARQLHGRAHHGAEDLRNALARLVVDSS